MAFWCGSKDATVELRQTQSFAYAAGISRVSFAPSIHLDTGKSQQTLSGVGVNIRKKQKERTSATLIHKYKHKKEH